jgi:hypothetical protein
VPDRTQRDQCYGCWMKLLFSLFLVAACGGSDAQVDARPIDGHAIDGRAIDGGVQTVVNGTLGGNSFGALDAIVNTASASGFDFDGMSTDVEITTYANSCDVQMTRTGLPNQRLLFFVLATTNSAGSSSPITAAGTYTVFSGTPPASSQLVEAYYEIDDASCHKSTSEFATSGTVTVTSTSPPEATFDLTFSDGHITGSYRATQCNALDPNSSPTC